MKKRREDESGSLELINQNWDGEERRKRDFREGVNLPTRVNLQEIAKSFFFVLAVQILLLTTLLET